MTQQELAVGAAKWACRTWVSGSYGYPRSWGKTTHYLVDNWATMFMGEHG